MEAVEAVDRWASIAPGVPGRCPACDGFGYLDHVDLAHHFQVQHCRECGHRWEYQFDEDDTLLTLRELPDPGVATEKVHRIDLTDAEATADRSPADDHED